MRKNIKIHKSADVSRDAIISKNTIIWNNAQIREKAKIGSDCILGKNVYIDKDVEIGNKVKIQNNVSIYKGIKIGSGVFIGPHVVFTNDKYPRSTTSKHELKKETDWKISKTYVEDGVSIGANSTILPGIRIGKNSMIGAGSVVTRDVKANTKVFGNPASFKGHVNSENNISDNSKEIRNTIVRFSDSEIKSITKVLKAGNVTQGKKVELFEKKYAKYVDIRHAIAVSNGTNALVLAINALGIGEGDEVITTPFSFIASANSILINGAKPVFVDIEKKTFNIDPLKIEMRITKNTKAILVVHLFGLPCDMDAIMRIARKYKLKVIEDASQAHGAEYKGKKVGSIGDVGCFSFYATKNISTIEGGMITTNSDRLSNKLMLLRNHGSSKKYHHEILGFNYRMTDVNATLGIEQLKKLDEIIYKRRINANLYNKKLVDLNSIVLPYVGAKQYHVYHQYSFLFKNNREIFMNNLKKKKIQCEIYYPIPIHKQKVYKSLGYKDSLPVAEKVSKEVVSIPVNHYLRDNDLEIIISSVFDAALKHK